MTVGNFTRLKVGTGLTGTDLGSGVIELATDGSGSSDPATDTKLWMPLFDSDGAVVLDSDEGLIPTLIFIA